MHPRLPILCALALLGLTLGACAAHLDPTQIFSPPPPLAHGVNLTVYFAGSSGNSPVMHVWVADPSGTNIRTLLTTSGGATYSCGGPNFCPCEGPSPGNGYWSLFCASQAGSSTFLTDGNTSATQSFPFSLPLYFGWDWKDRSGGSRAGDSNAYTLHAEVSGYYFGGVPGEAWITVPATAAGAVDNGTVDGTGHWLKISADWKQ